MVAQKKLFVASRMCFRPTAHSWLNHRRGRMTHYTDSISLCVEMIGADNFEKLEHLEQIFLEEMCSRIRKRLAALSIQYSLKQTVPQLADSGFLSLLKKSVTYPQYRAFMRSVFGYLLPMQLIGACNTQLAVDRISCLLFKLGFGESIRLIDLFSIPFKTSTLKWLKSLSSVDLCCIYRKFLLWLLEFSVHVTGATFYVTPGNRTSRLLFYRKDIWKRIESQSFHVLSEKRELKKVKGLKKNAVGERLRFLPKNSGMRSLMVPTGNNSQRQYSATALKIVSGVIDLVCVKQRKYSKELPFTGAAIWNGIRSFPRRFRRFIQLNDSARIYAVKTDVQECFDCINQNLLRSVLRKIIVLSKHFRLNGNMIGIGVLISARRYGFGCGTDSHNSNLLEFEYRDGVYRAFRGIPQGNHASARLCDIYLGAADCERYLELMRRRDTLLIRYVDDYLLLTTDVTVARKFLEVMHLGVDDSYNIIADSSKTVINFYCECNELLIAGKMVGSCSAVPWCGYVIYPGLKKYSIDWAKIHSEKAISCRIVHKMTSREKRIAVLRFLKASLLEKYRMVHRFPSGNWKVRVLKKFASIGTKLYARPYARKVRLSVKLTEMLDEESSLFGSDDEEDDEKRKDSPEDKKYLFRKEFRTMIYGFGDDKVPYDKTLELLETIVTNYIQHMCQRALQMGKPGKLALEDIHYLIRRDAKKFGRVKDLLSMSEELKKARKQFDEAKAI
uniref:Telomerase reverse transcriptase n=1 Tax=Setaria digitata TaxID=48799 RepID=A0A915PKW2_9BILA